MIEKHFVLDQMGGHWEIKVNGKFFCNVDDSELNEELAKAENHKKGKGTKP